MKRLLLAAIVFGIVLLLADISYSQSRTRVRFPAGSSGTAVKGTVRGYAYRDFLVRANADQTIVVSVASANRYTVLSVFRPDGETVDGAAQVDEFSGALPVTGDYVIRVGMMRAGARRPGSVSNFTLKISIN